MIFNKNDVLTKTMEFQTSTYYYIHKIISVYLIVSVILINLNIDIGITGKYYYAFTNYHEL